jgi:hypothetical protein
MGGSTAAGNEIQLKLLQRCDAVLMGRHTYDAPPCHHALAERAHDGRSGARRAPPVVVPPQGRDGGHGRSAISSREEADQSVCGEESTDSPHAAALRRRLGPGRRVGYGGSGGIRLNPQLVIEV